MGVISRALCGVGPPLRPEVPPILCSACAFSSYCCYSLHDLLLSICTSVQTTPNPAPLEYSLGRASSAYFALPGPAIASAPNQWPLSGCSHTPNLS